MRTLLEIVGWLGSGLIVLSLMQARLIRFRWMNFFGSVIATGYNAALGIWPFVAMNAIIAVISLYWLRRLYRERHDSSAYRVMPMDSNDAYLQQVLETNRDDISRFQPDFVATTGEPGRSAFLVVYGDEPAGIVAVRDVGDGVGLIELDWVKPRFRNFTPGEFVYGESRVLADAGFRRVEIHTHEALDREYMRRVGFHTERERWVRELAA